MGRLSAKVWRGLCRMAKGSVEPRGPTPRAEIREFNYEGPTPIAAQFSPGPRTRLPAPLRGGAASPSPSTRSAALPKRVRWHVWSKGRLRSEHLDESLIGALLVGIPAADANCTNHL